MGMAMFKMELLFLVISKQDYEINGGLVIMNDGIEKIMWVDENMKILNEVSKKAIKSQKFRGLKVGICLHIEAKTGCLVKKIIEAGADVAVCASNPLSTKNEIVSVLKELGARVYAKNGENLSEYNVGLQRVVDFQPNLYIDDGADLATLINNQYRGDYKLIGGTEETTTGIIRLKKMNNLKYPIINVNDALMKCMFDNKFGTGQSTLFSFLSTTNMSISGKKVVVCGYGWCGKGLASRLKGMGAFVIVCEVDAIKANEAIMDGFSVMKMNEASLVGDVFVTATGCCDVITWDMVDRMKDGAIIMNSGHFDNEIDVKEIKRKCQSSKQFRKHITEYVLYSGKKIYILAEGRLVNLVAGEGHPIEIIDLSFSLQFLSLIYLLENNLKAGLRRVPKEIDEIIARINLNNLGIEIDTLTDKQIKYLGGEGEV